MEWIILAAIIVWIVCGAFAYGLTFAYFQGKYSYIANKDIKADRWLVGIMSVFGPTSLIVALIQTNYGKDYGLKWK